MTITSMAKQLDVTPMTIYRRCKKNGVNIAELRDDAGGELTAEGVAVIASLFDVTAPRNPITYDEIAPSPDMPHDAQQPSQGASTPSVDVLQAKLDGAHALIDQLTSERDQLREQVTALQAALAAEQADRQAERRLLTAGDGDQPRRWRWPWARR